MKEEMGSHIEWQEYQEPDVVLFSRQAPVLLGPLHYGAIAKALYKAGQPLTVHELSQSASTLLQNSGREPLNATQLIEGIAKLTEVEIVYTEDSKLTLTPTGAYMADILSRSIEVHQSSGNSR